MTKTTILDEAIPVEETEEDLSALIYGRSGTGKTTIGGSFPGPVLFLDFKEEGTDSIRDVSGVEVLHISEWSELEETFWALDDGKHDYKTVVLDTISGVQDLAILAVKTSLGLDADAPTSQRIWGEVSGRMKEWIYNFRDLPMNVVFLAHDRVKENESEDIDDDGQIDPEVGPNVIPSVSKTLCAAVKLIGYTFIRQKYVKTKSNPPKNVRKVDWMLRIGPHPFYLTKIRTPKSFKVPESIEDPDYEKIKTLMRGKPLPKVTDKKLNRSK